MGAVVLVGTILMVVGGWYPCGRKATAGTPGRHRPLQGTASPE